MKEQETVMLELLIRVSALEKVLLSKNLITEDEFTNEVKAISEKVMSQIKAENTTGN